MNSIYLMSTSAFPAPTSAPTRNTRPYKSREAPDFQSCDHVVREEVVVVQNQEVTLIILHICIYIIYT